jgi:hypothetical protein
MLSSPRAAMRRVPRVLATISLQLLERRLIFNTFGDRPDVELARDPDDRLDDLPVFFVVEEITHKLHRS